MNILIIHGFNSGPGDKLITLEKEFPNDTVYCPQLNNDPINDYTLLQEFINNNTNIHIIGTSLGGFYTMLLAMNNNERDDLSFYMVNPLLKAYEFFTSNLNKSFKNHKNNFSFTISEEFILSLKNIQDNLLNNFYPHPNMYFYFGSLDTSIEHHHLIDKLYSFNKPINIKIDKQDHRFNDLSLIIKQIKENETI
jgi:hypothetical protein